MDWTAEKAMTAGHKHEPATKAEIEEALAHAVHAARRTFQRVGNDLLPTKWDQAHQYINVLLFKWQLAED